jgi:hypothetical protein
MRPFLLLILIFISFPSKGQVNLVVNPSFEDTVACPLGPGEIYNSNGWSSLNGSPDYMNSCNIFSMGAPLNWGGYQQPASGNAYAALVSYISTLINYREHIGCQLSSTLNIGTKYFVSFRVSLSLGASLDANCASNKIGATVTSVLYSGTALINNNPKIHTDSIIADSLNWTTVFGSFIADSAYNYIVIGNFFDDANTDTIKYYNTFSDAAYYYIDDVCLSTDSAFTVNYTYTSFTNHDFNQIFTIFPNPSGDYVTILNKNQIYDIRIYNAFGQELYFGRGNHQNEVKMDLRGFESGLLLINITSDNFNYKYKLIKQ